MLDFHALTGSDVAMARAWCRARMAKASCEAVSAACYEGTKITGFRYTHLLNPVIQ